MPYIPHTPEALLPRSDSKNPNATCRGLTSSGRPCRRAISASPVSSKPRFPSSNPIPRAGDPDAYCWQHKDQTAPSATAASQGLQNFTIRERSSVDTLIDRLGLLAFEERGTPLKPTRQSRPANNWERSSHSQRPERKTAPVRPKPISKPRSNLGLFCCIGEIDESPVAPRLARIPQKHQEKLATEPPFPKLPPRKAKVHGGLSNITSPSRQNPGRPSLNHQPSSRTAEFLSLIPKSSSPEMTSLLLAELAKPVSEFDEEGYIYIFWLTSTAIPVPVPSEAVSSLLFVPGRPGPSRSTSDMLKTFSTNSSIKNKEKTIMLKIGRASNVQRRLNEWTRQCGYNLSLVRYYPYYSSSPRAEEPPATPKKVPHAHKVERLIHIELQGRRMQGSQRCEACGREHREWFEVEAKREGIRAVDEVVRRWVDWAMRVENR